MVTIRNLLINNFKFKSIEKGEVLAPSISRTDLISANIAAVRVLQITSSAVVKRDSFVGIQASVGGLVDRWASKKTALVALCCENILEHYKKKGSQFLETLICGCSPCWT